MDSKDIGSTIDNDRELQNNIALIDAEGYVAGDCRRNRLSLSRQVHTSTSSFSNRVNFMHARSPLKEKTRLVPGLQHDIVHLISSLYNPYLSIHVKQFFKVNINVTHLSYNWGTGEILWWPPGEHLQN